MKSATKQDVERFCYNYSALPDRYDAGVVLYRNAFSIDSFDGKKDWLGLNQRSRKSPAAATHPTGSWRVRANQLSGKVEIDKKENYQLRDLANRQGLEENEYFKLFVKIITIGIAAFERYRQSIIRSIDKKNAPKPSPTTPIIDQILKGRNQEIHLTSNDVQALAQELSAIKAESKSFQDEKESTEKKYRYDVRILNVLATTGLKASSIAHELKNDRNSISVNYQYIVDALKEYGFWEELCSQEYTEYSYKNVPQLLTRNKAINQKIVAFMDTMLDEIEKKKFSPKNLSISGIMENIKANWVRDYASLSINLDVDETVYFETSEDIFTAIFDNLILNSWQQNKSSSHIVIDISIHKSGGFLKIVASTKRNGVEIQKSYKCSKRKPWYGVPIVKSGRVIFFKRYDLCPRISTNPAEIYTTDIAYNLRLHEGIEPESLVFCFYNSLTLAQCEFVGRYYAGGVSELTPNEFRTISIPYRQIKPCDIERVKQMFNDNEDLNQIVAFVNSKTLEADLSTDEIAQLNAIRTKLIKRRK